MAHTGPRTNANVLNYHIGRFNELFSFENNVWVYHSERVDAKMAADLGDMLGGLNYSYGLQYPGVPFPTDPDSMPADPKESFKARQRVSQNCAWVLITPQEAGALEAAGIDTHPYNQFYTVGGSGGLGMQEAVNPMSPSGYSFQTIDQQIVFDVDQAADKHVAEVAAAQGRTVPPPVNVP